MSDFFKNQKASTDLENLFKSYYEYFKIYKLATTTPISKWKLMDIENAMKWAKLVEDIYTKLCSKSYLQKFITGLKCLSLHWSITNINIEEIIKDPALFMRNVSF